MGPRHSSRVAPDRRRLARTRPGGPRQVVIFGHAGPVRLGRLAAVLVNETRETHQHGICLLVVIGDSIWEVGPGSGVPCSNNRPTVVPSTSASRSALGSVNWLSPRSTCESIGAEIGARGRASGAVRRAAALAGNERATQTSWRLTVWAWLYYVITYGRTSSYTERKMARALLSPGRAAIGARLVPVRCTGIAP